MFAILIATRCFARIYGYLVRRATAEGIRFRLTVYTAFASSLARNFGASMGNGERGNGDEINNKSEGDANKFRRVKASQFLIKTFNFRPTAGEDRINSGRRGLMSRRERARHSR